MTIQELNVHYDNTVNEMQLFSFLTDLSTNEVFTFSQAMKQENKLDFIDCNGKGSLRPCITWSLNNSRAYHSTPEYKTYQGNLVLQKKAKTRWDIPKTQSSFVCSRRNATMKQYLLVNLFTSHHYAQCALTLMDC